MFTYKIPFFSKESYLRWLTFAVLVFALLFASSALYVLELLSVQSTNRCHNSIYLCLVFYLGQKVFAYVYLIERMHVLSLKTHREDKVFWASSAIVLMGFGTIAGLAFAHPVTSISTIDNICRIGLPLMVTVPLLSFDIIVNFSLTVAFVYRAFWFAQIKGALGLASYTFQALPFAPKRHGGDDEELLKISAAKALLGTIAIILPTVANLVVLFKVNGHERVWLCFSVCLTDCES